MIEHVMENAKHLPGPAAYHPTLTFAQELAQQRELRKFLYNGGKIGAASAPTSARTPRAAR